MFKKKTFYAVIAATVLAIITAVCVGIFIPRTPSANAEAREDYYYRQLDPDARKFYDAIADMESRGLLKQGNGKYDLIANEVLSEAQCQSFSSSQKVLNTFGAARDAYYLDHPEIFYVDFSYLTVNVRTKGDGYEATLGNGRAENYYIQNAFYSATDVENAISSYNTKLNEVAGVAKSFTDVADKVKAVNKKLAESVEYSFCDNNMDAPYAPHIRNAYGALVNGKAVCEGYARSFKCVMDKLGIPCVIVHGYASDDGGPEPHAWNHVKIGENWYGVDVTWNNTTGSEESYLLRGADVMDKEHIPDGVISAASYKFTYPHLAKSGYGSAGDTSINVEVVDQGEGSKLYKVSMEGKNSTKLADSGLWLSYRYYHYNEHTGEMEWTQWAAIKKTFAVEEDPESSYSPATINPNEMYVQFGVLSGTPDMFGYLDPSSSRLIASTGYYENEGYTKTFGAPFIKSTSPTHHSANLDTTKTYPIEITYTQKLKMVDEDVEIGISVSTYNNDTMKYAEISDVVWDGNDKVSFKFTPSAMYQHRDEAYTFTPTNLVGELSGKTPMSVTYLTQNKNVACNRVYPDGRLYVNSYGQPSLVGSGDLSLNGWKDADGNPVSENQRSQLMLVATKTTEKEGKEMVEKAPGLPQEAVKSAETFEIQLNLCKNIVKIPNGSKVQVAFGFPAGYGPEDAGVTFKVYHFKRGENGKIDYNLTEELDCIITEYGIMVNVSDFSPFAVVAVDKTMVPAVKKSVFARSVGFGGSFQGEVAQLVDSGNSVTYTLNPEEGYKVERVTLNGEDIEVSGNTVTLSYDALKDRNNVEFHYVANSVAQAEAGDTGDEGNTGDTGNSGANEGNGNVATPTAAIAISVSAAVVVIAAIAVAVVIILKKKKNK